MCNQQIAPGMITEQLAEQRMGFNRRVIEAKMPLAASHGGKRWICHRCLSMSLFEMENKERANCHVALYQCEV